MNARVFTGLALALVLLAGTVAGAETIRVPIDQPTIAAGLAAAMPGDEVVVDPGVYYEFGLQIPCGVTLKGATGNICEDPQFCSTDGRGDNLWLQSDSPCLDCDGINMGDYDSGCGESAAAPSNWSLVKALY